MIMELSFCHVSGYGLELSAITYVTAELKVSSQLVMLSVLVEGQSPRRDSLLVLPDVCSVCVYALFGFYLQKNCF